MMSRERATALPPGAALGRNVFEKRPSSFLQTLSGLCRGRTGHPQFDAAPEPALLDVLIDGRDQIARLLRPHQLIEPNNSYNFPGACPVERQAANLEEIRKRLDSIVMVCEQLSPASNKEGERATGCLRRTRYKESAVSHALHFHERGDDDRLIARRVERVIQKRADHSAGNAHRGQPSP